MLKPVQFCQYLCSTVSSMGLSIWSTLWLIVSSHATQGQSSHAIRSVYTLPRRGAPNDMAHQSWIMARQFATGVLPSVLARWLVYRPFPSVRSSQQYGFIQLYS